MSSARPFFNGETVSYAYDPKAQPLRIDCSHFAQTFAYSPVGNLLNYMKGTAAHTYRYNSLYQLTAEEGPAIHTYSYDSLQNRHGKDERPCTINALNQIEADGQKHYIYDPNGNCLAAGDRTFQYDALDRLIADRKSVV